MLESARAGWRDATRDTGWRRKLALALVLAAVAALFALGQALGTMPQLPGQWQVDLQGRVVLVAAPNAALDSAVGQELAAVVGADGQRIDMHPRLLLRSTRWIVGDAARAEFLASHLALDTAQRAGPVELEFQGDRRLTAQAATRGMLDLGLKFWLCGLLAAALLIVAVLVLTARPILRNALYAAMALAQAFTLLLQAADSTFALSLPPALLPAGTWHLALDLITATAVVHSAAVSPRLLGTSPWISGAAWAGSALLVAALLSRTLVASWWWVQAVTFGYGLVVVALLSWSQRTQPHPFASLMRRFVVAALGGWLLLSGAVAFAAPGRIVGVVDTGSLMWSGYFASLLLVMPFLARSLQLVREFAMLAATTLVAAALDLFFMTAFALGPLTSLALALLLSASVYAALRQWVVNQMIGNSMVTAERMFEQLYRVAREVEQEPSRAPALLSGLLRELFDPLESGLVEPAGTSARVIDDGSALVVPVPDLDPAMHAALPPQALLIRYAQRGRRLFTLEDARLADRVVEQLRRAVAFDQAVEQGRSEERTRIAQDLHDDIGARLLTLMYKAPSPEMEEYVRHTLQDLKTLTRGLAAPTHRLSDSIGEWKADIAQRLSVVHCELGWSASIDRDVMLSVVQWSALTRVLRELVSNTISHAQATRVDIEFTFENDKLELAVADNGIGREPASWSHGLGLGGVRKRVKQLGGEVDWRENLEQGITCRVRIRDWRH